MMKKLLLGALISSVTLFALPNSEMELAMIAKASQKKAIVLTNMQLKGETKEQFGNLYDEYQLKLLKQELNHARLIGTYVANYKQMTNETSDQLIIKWAALEKAEFNLKAAYILKFRKFMQSAKVVRYFQIESRFKAMRRSKSFKMIPLATPPALSADMAIVTTDAPESNVSK